MLHTSFPSWQDIGEQYVWWHHPEFLGIASRAAIPDDAKQPTQGTPSRYDRKLITPSVVVRFGLSFCQSGANVYVLTDLLRTTT